MQRGDRVGGRYEIRDRVASGGMGTVFRGREVASHRPVAIKIIEAASASDGVRFAREAEILAAFTEPGVVRYIAHGPDYLVMEWVEGETLRQRLDRAPLPVGETLALAAQLTGSLAALHAAGIVHRDVKPANLMLCGRRTTLVDFGIARSVAGIRVTRTGMFVGTAGYMAPEQARGDRAITSRADLFALGCVLYECVTGAPAFRGDTALALRAKVQLHDPAPLRAVVPALPDALGELVMRLLRREPEGRPSAGEAGAAIAAIARGWSDELAGPAGEDAAPAWYATAAITERSPEPGMPCAVVIAGDAAVGDRIAELVAGAVTVDGGAVALQPDPVAAAQIALAIAATLPAAILAIACGRADGDAIDRGARMIEQLDVSEAAGEPVAGAWLDPEVAGALDDAFAIERRGQRYRLRGTR